MALQWKNGSDICNCAGIFFFRGIKFAIRSQKTVPLGFDIPAIVAKSEPIVARTVMTSNQVCAVNGILWAWWGDSIIPELAFVDVTLWNLKIE